MLVFCLLIVLILIILIIIIFASSNSCNNNSYNNFKKNKKEKYGPPPGKKPAVNFLNLGYRGWPSAPYEFSGVTAGALSNYIEAWPEYSYQQQN